MLIAPMPLPEPPPATIVVTGKALPEPASERVYAIDRIGRDRLVDSPSRRLETILASVPGLQLFRRSDSTSGHPTGQGVTLRALGGNASSRALLVLDGVPQADPFGGWVNWPAYDPQGLGEIRIVRGGGSVAFGPGALAGTIEMTSLAATGARGALEIGSRRSLAASANLGASAGAGLLTVNARASRSDGFVPVTRATRGPVDRPSPYSEASLRTRWVAPVADNVELQASALGFVDSRERGLPFSSNRTSGLDGSVRLVGTGPWQWSAAGFAQWRLFRSSFASVDDDRTEARRVALQDEVPSDAIGASVELRPPVGPQVELRIGADARFADGESRELYAFAAQSPTRRRVAGGRSSTMGLFAEAAWTTGPLVLSGGARIDRWRIADGKLVERIIATGASLRDDSYADRNGWRPTARAGVLVDAGHGFSLRSAAYLGWRMPTLNELFRPFRAGPDATAANALLDPERLSGAEAGLGFSNAWLDLSLTAFANRLSGAIANVTLARGPGVFPGVGFVAGNYRQRRNVRSVDSTGIEAGGEARSGDWTFTAGASLVDARVRADGPAASIDGLRPAQTPKFTLSGSVGWESEGRAASVLVRHEGNRFEDDLNSARLPAATLVGAFAALPFSDRLQIFARGENLLGATFASGIDDDGTVERGAARTMWIGLRLTGR